MDGLVLIVGGRGSGKTCLLQKIEKLNRAKGRHFTIWDHMGHWAPKPGREVVRTDDPEEAAVRAIELAPTTLIVDEASLAYPAAGPPRRGSALHEINRIGRQARGHGRWKRKGPVALIAATQRPADVTTSLKNLLDVLYVGRFPASAHADLKWIADTVGPEAAERAKTRAALEFERIQLS